MKHKRIYLVLLAIFLAACDVQPPVAPGLELSSEYQGALGVEGKRNETLLLYVAQEGNKITGEYFFDFRTGIDRVYGTLSGSLREGQLKLSLKVPPHFIREYGMSSTMELTLTGTACSKKEAQNLLKSVNRDSKAIMEKPQMLTGQVVFTAFQETREEPISLANQATADNRFNK